MVTSYAAIVLAGGAGRRMGTGLKPLVPVGGEPMLRRVLRALADAAQIVVVGPDDLANHLTTAVRLTREEPPGSGPVAAIAAGARLLPESEWVAVVGGDLPFLSSDALASLRQKAHEVAVYVDDEGRRQSMVTVWRGQALNRALEGVPRAMHGLLNAAVVTEVSWEGGHPPPWYDCDTPQDLERAERLA